MPGSLLDSNVSPYSRGGVEIPAGGWIWTTAPSPLGGLRSTANPRHRWWGGACGRQGHPGVLSHPSPLDLGRRPQSEAGRAVVTASAQLRLSTSGNRGVRGTAGHQGWRLSPSVAPRVRRSVSGEPTFLMNILEGGSGSPLGLTPLKADGLVRGRRGRGWGAVHGETRAGGGRLAAVPPSPAAGPPSGPAHSRLLLHASASRVREAMLPGPKRLHILLLSWLCRRTWGVSRGRGLEGTRWEHRPAPRLWGTLRREGGARLGDNDAGRPGARPV